MARAFAIHAVLAIITLFCFTGCGSGQARTSLRNAVVAAQVLQHNEDPAVQTAARAIEVQVTASADQMDEVLWGLWTNRSKATITAQDWEDSAASAARRSDVQAEATVQETRENHAAVSQATGLLGALGLPMGLTGGGLFAAAAAWVLKNRQDLKSALTTAVSYGHEVAPATTPEAVQVVKAKYKLLANPVLKAEVAKHKA